jgi:hypothetical protein|tara:strand:- start:303 stop:671 length:369 start_codon:yes stop_codon:yes gene_type:complete
MTKTYQLVLGLISLLGLILLLQSITNQGSNTGADRYRFEVKEYEKTSLEVEIVISANIQEFNNYAKQYLDGPQDKNIQAFGRLFPSTNKCIIYVRDPEWDYAPEFIGHELAHCIWGRWHLNQ